MVYLYENSTTCWAWVLNDFGSVVSTVLALTTFLCLFFFCYMLHRTLKSRSQPKTDSTKGTSGGTSPEKSRRKRRKGKNDRTRADKQSGRTENSSSNSLPLKPLQNSSSKSDPLIGKEDSATASSSDVQDLLIPAVNEHIPTDNQEDRPRSRTASRVDSPATVDGLAMDMSFEDASEQSSIEVQHAVESIPSNAAAGRNNRTRKNRLAQAPRHFANPRSIKSEKTNARKNEQTVFASRWDALKPDNGEKRRLASRTELLPQGDHSISNRDKNRSKASQKQKNSVDRVASPACPTAVRLDARPSGLNSNPPAIHLWSTSIPFQTPSGLTLPATSTLNGNTNISRPSTAATHSSLNPDSPIFAPSRPLGLRPPPGLGPPSSAKNFEAGTSVEPLFLPPPSPPPVVGATVPWLTLPSGSTSPSLVRPRDNPFADDEEEQIAAELQELGGQMVGSILDF